MNCIDYFFETIYKYMFVFLDFITLLFFPIMPLFIQDHILIYLENSRKVREFLDNKKWYTFNDYITKPWLIIDFLLKLLFFIVVVGFFILASISFFINSRLDPLEGYDVALFVFELTGHYPNTVFLM